MNSKVARILEQHVPARAQALFTEAHCSLVTLERGELYKDRSGALSRFRPARPELWSINERRNIPLAQFAALESLEADFYSLQKGEPAETEFAELNARGWAGPKIENLACGLGDFADSAALIEQRCTGWATRTDAKSTAG